MQVNSAQSLVECDKRSVASDFKKSSCTVGIGPFVVSLVEVGPMVRHREGSSKDSCKHALIEDLSAARHVLVVKLVGL